MNLLKKYSIHLTSLSPLILNNDTLANPLHPMSKKVKSITCLKNKQDEHHLAIARLTWEASLYYDEEELGIYLPSKMIAGCFKASAKKEKKGTATKAIIIDAPLGVPLIPYQNYSPEKLWSITNKKENQVHVHSATVTVQKAKTMRTRPIFPTWEVKFNIFLNVDILSEQECLRIIERAGFEYGFGEMRPQLAAGTYGRFKLEKMEQIE